MPYTSAPDGWWQEFLGARPAHTAKLAVVKADGSPHVAPVWIDLDGDDVVFTTGSDTVKGRAILRDPRVSVVRRRRAPAVQLRHGQRAGARLARSRRAAALGDTHRRPVHGTETSPTSTDAATPSLPRWSCGSHRRRSSPP